MTDAGTGFRPHGRGRALTRGEIRRLLAGSCGESLERAQRCLDTEQESGTSEATPAAVLVGLVEREGEPWVILTRRTAHLADHPGEISLPGGRVEPEDGGPAAAALREAWEEIGLPRERVEVLGCLPLYRTVSDYCVHPIVAWVDSSVDSPVEFVPDEREVADVFLVPLDFILDPANHGRGSLVRGEALRTFYVLQYRHWRIWGATAGILVSLARVLGMR